MGIDAKLSRGGAPSVVSRALRSARVWVIQGVGTLICLALAYACLQIGKANWLQLTACSILALFLVYVAAFLQRTALRVFRRDRLEKARRGKKKYKVEHREAKEWLPDAAIVLVLFMALAGWNAVVLQWLPDALLAHVEMLEAALVWLLFVILWLPLAAGALLGESSLWRPAVRAWKRPNYWLGTLASAAVCWFAPISLLSQSKVPHWLEGAESLDGEGLLLVVLVYVILLGAWLVILALVEAAIAAPEQRSLDDTWD